MDIAQAGRMLRTFAALGLLLFAGACATAGTQLAEDEDDDNDPIEPVNRAVFEFNRTVDGLLLKPAAQIYRGVVPEPARDGVRNFLDNLRSPLVLANALLQGDGQRAGDTFARFWINTVLGPFGIRDIASELNIPRHNEDFGQTLAVWGAGEGPYLMLPLLGPSNPRDAGGYLVEWVVDPFNWATRNSGAEGLSYSRTGTNAVDTRSRNIEMLDSIERTSLDFYATIRSLYRQRRASDIRNRAPSGPAITEIGEPLAPQVSVSDPEAAPPQTGE